MPNTNRVTVNQLQTVVDGFASKINETFDKKQDAIDRVSPLEQALGGHTVGKDVPSDAVFTDTVYDDSAVTGRLDAAESAIQTLQTSNYDDTAITARVAANETAINTLNGSGAGSVSKAISDAIDAVVNGAPPTLDTLKEIADWIQDDQTGAAALAADVANKVDKVDGKGLSTEDFTTAEKTKLSGLSNYDDTSLAGRVSTVETSLDDKANTADLSAVATSGSYNDLSDTPDEYILPEASDTTLGGIKVDSTSGATVEDGVLKVAQQTASGGGAIPAYIVGETMTQGWLSLEENGEALTPADKQEYIILSSGDWLRKHVMWFADLNAYRLTGKVGITNDVQRKIITGQSTGNVTVPTGKVASSKAAVTVLSFNVSDGDVVDISFTWHSDSTRGFYVGIQGGTEDFIATDSGAGRGTKQGTYSKVWNITQDGVFNIRCPYTANATYYNMYIERGTCAHTTNSILKDYETDDVLDITEEEIDAIWNETAGSPTPANNVIAVDEERLWGYWKESGVTKPIYQNVVNCGALPVNTEKAINHGIADIDKMVYLNGCTFDGNGTMLPLPFVHHSPINANIYLSASKTQIIIWTAISRTGFSNTYVTVRYTKTTD